MKTKYLILQLAIIFGVFVFFSCEKEPQANFSVSNSDIEVGDYVYFINYTLDGNSYYWDFGDGTTSYEFSPSHIYNNEGNYTIKLTAYSKNGKKENIYAQNIIVNHTTDLSLIVYYSGTSNTVFNCHISLFTTLNDWDYYTNLVCDGYTDIYGEITFSRLKSIVYYINAYKVGYPGYYCNWYLGYMTNNLTAHEINYYKVYVQYYYKKDGTNSYKIDKIEPILNGDKIIEKDTLSYKSNHDNSKNKKYNDLNK